MNCFKKISKNYCMQRALRNKIAIASVKKGFTLAEVLVTLAVIGVVASMTIPALMKTTEKAQIVASVKKYTTTLNQAVKMYSIENDCIGNLAACDAFAGDGQHEQVYNAIKPYFKLAKDCGIATGEGCFAPGVTYKLLNGDNYYTYDDIGMPKVVLTDGASILIMDLNGNCSNTLDFSGNTKICAQFFIDINGHKGSNQIGKDVFSWWITKAGTVIPQGVQDDKDFADTTTGEPDCDPDGTAVWNAPGGGHGCAGYVMRYNNADYLD